MTNYYLVADHLFSIEAEPHIFDLMSNYAPFLISRPATRPLISFHINLSTFNSQLSTLNLFHTDMSDDDMPRIEIYKSDDKWLFGLSVTKNSPVVCHILCSQDWKEVTVYADQNNIRFAIDNATMLVYAFATSSLRTLLFHAAVIKRHEQAVLFLGRSGTGKSTHAQQWLKAFNDAELLNDDNPVVRIIGDEVRVYGSPWSGKTPCYKNISAPVSALVQLAQSPVNKINQLRMTQAYPYILASVSGLKMIPQMMDNLYDSISSLLSLRPVYFLDCLPNPDAARLCAQTCLS